MFQLRFHEVLSGLLSGVCVCVGGRGMQDENRVWETGRQGIRRWWAGRWRKCEREEELAARVQLHAVLARESRELHASIV